ncbi:WSC-domain-containing protein [Polyplosphaeria fusca]|uniref:WSC-domain-containing protein n=1 Tax=Polyplosphaeria fusca TaxID=682080 RepID=A0A9P4UTX5_9PLEO|nr:WSC-domain-containing protein [Polyplosphaeria fusca]
MVLSARMLALVAPVAFHATHPQLSRRHDVRPEIPLPPASDLLESWKYYGCYSDNVAARTLKQDGYFDYNSMTGEACVDYCHIKGYPLAGTEYKSECYCGSQIPSGVTTGDCWMPCSGNSSEVCGGPDAITIYSGSGATSPACQDASYIGCYSDSVGQRTLQFPVSVAGGSSAMTVGGCTDTCRAKGYQFAGLEYARECWCGDDLRVPGRPVQGIPKISGCNMICTGDGGAFCGGPDRLKLIQRQHTLLLPYSSRRRRRSRTAVAAAAVVVTVDRSTYPIVANTMDMDLQHETSQVQVVSKQFVILNTTNDWKPWYKLKKDQAKRLKIWEFVDPEGNRKFEDKVVEPIEPQLINYAKRETSTARSQDFGEEADLPEFKDLTPQKDFIQAINSLNNVWANTKLMKMIAHINRGIPAHSFMLLHILVDEFHQLYHLQRPIASTLGTFSAFLGVAKEEKKREQTPTKSRPQKCWCGQQHPVQGLLPRAFLSERLERLLEGKSREAEQIRKVIDDLESRSSQGPRPLDGGKRPQRITQSNAIQQSFSSQNTSAAPPLINRWILDPGSDVHACNSKAFGWTSYKEPQEDGESYLYAEGQKLRIESWGSVVISGDNRRV